MGWLFQNQKLRHETPADYITRTFTYDGEIRRSTVLATATVGNVIYAAIRNEEKETGRAYVFAAVVLFRNSARDGFGYKDMCESMGPVECDCPDRIMRLLSPVEDIPQPSFTAAWRARVAARKAERRGARESAAAIVVGDIVRLPNEVTLRPGGVRARAFRLVGRRKRTRLFEPLDHPGVICRLSARLLADASVERCTDTAASP